MLGPNLEVVGLTGTLFSGTGPCVGGTSSFVASPTSPGFSATGIPTPCAEFSSTQSETFSVAAINGYEIHGISLSGTCGVTGSNSLTFSASSSTVNSVTATCPEESSVGATAAVSNQLAFTPATNLTATISSSNTSTVGGSSSDAAVSFYFLLAPAIGTCANPNPNPNPNPAAFANPGDFNGDCKSDILWRNSGSEEVYEWLVNGTSILSQGSPGGPSSAWAIEGAGDFNGDGKSDILWQNSSTGEVYVWLMNGTTIASQGAPGTVTPSSGWVIAGVGDFDGNGTSDILWRNTISGEVYLWLMNGATIASQGDVGVVSPSSGWVIVGVGDFNGDGKADILWQNTATGEVYIWLMNGTTIASQGSPGTVSPSSGWVIQGAGDFDGNGMSDILWRNSTSGEVYIWLMNGMTIAGQGSPGTVSSAWSIKGTGDYNGDGKADVLWQNSSGEVYVWEMNGLTITGQGSPGTASSPWQIATLAP